MVRVFRLAAEEALSLSLKTTSEPVTLPLAPL